MIFFLKCDDTKFILTLYKFSIMIVNIELENSEDFVFYQTAFGKDKRSKIGFLWKAGTK